MSIDFIFRIIGMFGFAVLGWRIGDLLSAPSSDTGSERYILVLALAGAALGLLITP
jgi:hypothetical protein